MRTSCPGLRSISASAIWESKLEVGLAVQPITKNNYLYWRNWPAFTGFVRTFIDWFKKFEDSQVWRIEEAVIYICILYSMKGLRIRLQITAFSRNRKLVQLSLVNEAWACFDLMKCQTWVSRDKWNGRSPSRRFPHTGTFPGSVWRSQSVWKAKT